MMRIGVMGYSTTPFDEIKARRLIRTYFSSVISNRPVIVSGLSNIGVPGLAYDIARQLGLSTVGIACSKVYTYPCYPCDEVIIVGDKWGDESTTFVTYCDSFLAVGGGKQTRSEVEMAKSMGKYVKEFAL